MADVMKSLLVGFLLCGIAWAAETKPYNGTNVTVQATKVAVGVVRIEARSVLWVPPESQQYRSFVFSCEIGKLNCVSPKVGQVYVLRSPERKMNCDGYDLGRDKSIPVCLLSVH
jgi:hypothetical protein